MSAEVSQPNSLPLYLYARTPVAGRVKTRMQTRFDADTCARLALAMIQTTVERAVRVWQGEVVLSVWPSTDHPEIDKIARAYPVRMETQVAGDLGEKMAYSLTEGVSNHGAAAVMGCDVPHFVASDFRAAYAALSRGRNVLGPAADGGFYFLGLNRVPPALFRGIEWGGQRVLEQLRASAKRCGIELHQRISTLTDLDDPEDLAIAIDTCGVFRRRAEEIFNTLNV